MSKHLALIQRLKIQISLKESTAEFHGKADQRNHRKDIGTLLGFMAKQIHETAGKTLGRAGFYCKADPRNCRKDIGTLLGFMAKQIHETAGKTLGHCWVLWRSRSTKLPERHWDTAGFYGEADP